MEEELNKIVYSKNTIEFVTVAKEFCTFVENATELDGKTFVDKTLKLLSLLYLKALLLPNAEQLNEEGNEKFVTEFDWQFIKNGIASILDEKDTYLDFFDSEMNETPEPVTSSISENLADVYQDLKDFLEIYKLGNDNLSNDAIFECTENFKNFWGYRIVNTIRILHLINFYPVFDEQSIDILKTHAKRNSKDWFISQAQNDFQSNE
jgi:hypothetical protein